MGIDCIISGDMLSGGSFGRSDDIEEMFRSLKAANIKRLEGLISKHAFPYIFRHYCKLDKLKIGSHLLNEIFSVLTEDWEWIMKFMMGAKSDPSFWPEFREVSTNSQFLELMGLKKRGKYEITNIFLLDCYLKITEIMKDEVDYHCSSNEDLAYWNVIGFFKLDDMKDEGMWPVGDCLDILNNIREALPFVEEGETKEYIKGIMSYFKDAVDKNKPLVYW